MEREIGVECGKGSWLNVYTEDRGGWRTCVFSRFYWDPKVLNVALDELKRDYKGKEVLVENYKAESASKNIRIR